MHPNWKPPYLLTHGSSLSNAPLFVAEGMGLLTDAGIDVKIPTIEDFYKPASLLHDQLSGIGSIGYAQPLIDAWLEDPLVVVAGSGARGVSLVAQSNFAHPSELSRQRIGTFRGDPLEVLLYDILSLYKVVDTQVVYFDSLPEGINAFNSKEIGALTIVEPHSTRLREHGAIQLSDGTDVWGDDFPDTVLVASRSFLHSKPEVVKSVIRAMLRAESLLLMGSEMAFDTLLPHFPGFSRDELAEAIIRQPPRLDLRDLESFFPSRWPTLSALGLVSGESPGEPITSWTLFEQVLAEEVDAFVTVGVSQPVEGADNNEDSNEAT